MRREERRRSPWRPTWLRCFSGCERTSYRWPVRITPRVASCSTSWSTNCEHANRFVTTASDRWSAPWQPTRRSAGFCGPTGPGLGGLGCKIPGALETAREVLNVEFLAPDDPVRWPLEAALRNQLGSRYFPLCVAADEVAGQTVRASSLVENFNSRLRNYFFFRRHLGPDYLALLQFFLNHRRFPRSDRPEREGKSPAELLSGSPHPHWLEMLGYTRFSRN